MVVKVLRPGIEQQIAADIALLKVLAALVDRTHPAADKIRPRQIVAEIESTLAAELDLQREGANASVIRRNWSGSADLYVPEVVWSHTAERALTLERVHGIPSDDIAALDAAGIDRKALAAKGVRVFYTQVFRDNFFHADAHAGNIWVDPDPARRHDPRFIALDFGIMGQLSSEDQYYLAENFMAIFNRDYRRIAELHVQAGWMPSHIRIDELEAAARSVCEPYFTRPLAEISLGEVLLKLFRTAQRYELTIQPQLILLQKTLFNIEGVGRQLDPEIDIWAVARPVLEKILVERYSPQRLGAEFRKRLPEMVTHAPDMPRLLHAWLTQQVEGKQQMHMHSQQLAELARATTRSSAVRCARSSAPACWWPRRCCTRSTPAVRVCSTCRPRPGSPHWAACGRCWRRGRGGVERRFRRAARECRPAPAPARVAPCLNPPLPSRPRWRMRLRSPPMLPHCRCCTSMTALPSSTSRPD